ncbi:hypothetical protein EVAR_31306_1 [Eumeta japonica]|uniref:Uncharacterized protein n=1 Tax=Eumeta variegata TaxID=151549 RepID=A0A4C1VR88_EUMVA|nr:hypothetical protein EVAR_31306_1 [Eumeta japonica]
MINRLTQLCAFTGSVGDVQAFDVRRLCKTEPYPRQLDSHLVSLCANYRPPRYTAQPHKGVPLARVRRVAECPSVLQLYEKDKKRNVRCRQCSISRLYSRYSTPSGVLCPRYTAAVDAVQMTVVPSLLSSSSSAAVDRLSTVKRSYRLSPPAAVFLSAYRLHRVVELKQLIRLFNARRATRALLQGTSAHYRKTHRTQHPMDTYLLTNNLYSVIAAARMPCSYTSGLRPPFAAGLNYGAVALESSIELTSSTGNKLEISRNKLASTSKKPLQLGRTAGARICGRTPRSDAGRCARRARRVLARVKCVLSIRAIEAAVACGRLCGRGFETFH